MPYANLNAELMKTETNYSPAVICYGEILWDVLPDGPQPGGAPLNVAYHLHKLGVGTSLISRIGNDPNGAALAGLMKGWGLDKSLLQTDEQHDTSQVLARMNNGNEVSYEIVYPVAWDFISENTVLAAQVSAAKYLVYGSLASRNEVSRQTLFRLLDNTSAIRVFDINLRPPFISRALLEVLLGKSDIVKFNEAELDVVQVMFGGYYQGETDKVHFIQDKFDVQEVIVTKGEFGASYYTDQAFHIWSTAIKVMDTIGSGDAFLAAFISSHFNGLQPQEILKNAVGMGGFIATKKGGCPGYSLSEYQNFKNQLFDQ